MIRVANNYSMCRPVGGCDDDSWSTRGDALFTILLRKFGTSDFLCC